MFRCALRRLGTSKKKGGKRPRLVYHPNGEAETDMQMHDDAQQLSRVGVVSFPHIALLHKSEPVGAEALRSVSFATRLLQLQKAAALNEVLSICAAKIKWNEQVILLRDGPNGEWETWVNPVVPHYDDKHAVTSMYGMWENDLSMGLLSAWVIRPQVIKVFGLDEFGGEKEATMGGLKARLLMHELDYLRGTNMLRQATGPDFIVALSSLLQKQLWAPHFPSMEAHATGPMQFFNYTTNQVDFVGAGLDSYASGFADMSTMFDDRQITGK